MKLLILAWHLGRIPSASVVMKTIFMTGVLACAWAGLLMGETVKDREGAVRADKAKMEKDERWIYDDVPKGFAEAKRTGKPLLVVLRCIPCMSCMGIDASVLTEQDIRPLLDQFVCVRVINANALDLSLFQMDTDLSFSTLFFNGDGTVYGRFGSWTHQKNAQETDLSSYKAALEGALKLHAGYPGNKEALNGKQPGPTPFKSPVEIPMLAAKYKTVLDWEGKVVGSCVHCHMIGDAYRTWYRDQKQAIPDEWLYPFPGPETVGLHLSAEAAATVVGVEQGTAAEAAGFKAEDEILSLGGQPMVSVADVSWVLHRAGGAGEVAAVVKRGTEKMTLSLKLAEGWREKTDASKRVGAWPMRGMAAGGLRLADLTDEQRAERGLGKEGMALIAEGVGMYGKHAAAKKAGFLKDDVLVEVDGLKNRLTESQLHAHLLRKRFPGEMVDVVVLRNGERKPMRLPIQ